MNFFTGTYEHTLDVKGRVIVPASLRGVVDESDGPGLVLTTAPENCLVMYTPVKYQRLCEEQADAPRGSLEFRRFQRNWYASAELLGLDKQGRILLPEKKRSLVKIERELVFAGCGDHIENVRCIIDHRTGRGFVDGDRLRPIEHLNHVLD